MRPGGVSWLRLKPRKTPHRGSSTWQKPSLLPWAISLKQEPAEELLQINATLRRNLQPLGWGGCQFFGICHSDEAEAPGYVCQNPPQSPFTKGGSCGCPLRKGEAVGALYEKGRLWVPYTKVEAVGVAIMEFVA